MIRRYVYIEHKCMYNLYKSNTRISNKPHKQNSSNWKMKSGSSIKTRYCWIVHKNSMLIIVVFYDTEAYIWHLYLMLYVI